MPKLPSLKAKQVINVLLKVGFMQRNTSGSHIIFRHPQTGKIVPVPFHGGRDIKKGTLRSIVRQSGLSLQEFVDLL